MDQTCQLAPTISFFLIRDAKVTLLSNTLRGKIPFQIPLLVSICLHCGSSFGYGPYLDCSFPYIHGGVCNEPCLEEEARCQEIGNPGSNHLCPTGKIKLFFVGSSYCRQQEFVTRDPEILLTSCNQQMAKSQGASTSKMVQSHRDCFVLPPYHAPPHF